MRSLGIHVNENEHGSQELELYIDSMFTGICLDADHGIREKPGSNRPALWLYYSC
jgi:hypothetical protein